MFLSHILLLSSLRKKWYFELQYFSFHHDSLREEGEDELKEIKVMDGMLSGYFTPI